MTEASYLCFIIIVKVVVKNVSGSSDYYEFYNEKVVVLSAVSGTTNSLVEIHTAYKKEGKKAAHKLIDKLEAKYHPFIQHLYDNNASIKKAQKLSER